MPRLALVALLLCTLAASAEDRRPKKIWQWTIEERLAERFDPENIKARDAQYKEDFRAQLAKVPPEMIAKGEETGPGVIRHSVDGRRNPELFLPHELFDSLMTGFMRDVELRMKQRGFFADVIREAGFDDVLLWQQLSAWGADYIELRHGQRPRTDKDEECRARYAALQAAREHYGHERFDWFLYVVVAPETSKASAVFNEDPVARLRRAENGCR